MWWIDSGKQSQFEKAQRDSSIKLDTGMVENRYWLDFDQKHPAPAAPATKGKAPATPKGAKP